MPSFQELKRPPLLSWRLYKPPHYLDQGHNTIFIPTDVDDPLSNKELVQYDLDKQEIIAEYKYPDIEVGIWTNCIDTEQEILHITHGWGMISFDIKTKTWTKSINEEAFTKHFGDVSPDPYYIPRPMNKLLLIHDKSSSYFKYQNVDKILKLGGFPDNIGITGKVMMDKYIYCKQLQIFMIFLPKSKQPLFCDIRNKNQSNAFKSQ